MPETFPRKKILSPNEYLTAAEEAERYVKSFLQETADGLAFTGASEGTPKNSYYSGTAGILHMYLQLYRVNPTAEYHSQIQKLTRYLSLHYLDDLERAKSDGEFIEGMAFGFYTGLAGIGLVLNEVWNDLRDETAHKAATEILEYHLSHAKEIPGGDFLAWTDNAVVFFDSGILLYLIDSYKSLGRTDLLPIICKAADYILHNGISHSDGGLEIDYGHIEFKHKEPNFEFGTAGAGYTLLKCYELTKDEKYLEAAKRTAVYLESIAVKQAKGFLIPYKLTLPEQIFYLGNCHGPVGTIKLFYELHRVTGDKHYLSQVKALCNGIESLGAPTRFSPGYWNTTCVCCGPAGFVPLYVGLFLDTKDEHFKSLVTELGEILLGTKISQNGSARWQLAFERIHPERISAPAGYYVGAAGIAVALLQLYRASVPGKPITNMIDDPYPKSGN